MKNTTKESFAMQRIQLLKKIEELITAVGVLTALIGDNSIKQEREG